MSCPKRPYKILGLFNSYKPHEWKIEEVGVFMRGESDYFSVRYQCPHCELTQKRHFVTGEELMKEGYTIEQLHDFRLKVI